VYVSLGHYISHVDISLTNQSATYISAVHTHTQITHNCLNHTTSLYSVNKDVIEIWSNQQSAVQTRSKAVPAYNIFEQHVSPQGDHNTATRFICIVAMICNPLVLRLCWLLHQYHMQWQSAWWGLHVPGLDSKTCITVLVSMMSLFRWWAVNIIIPTLYPTLTCNTSYYLVGWQMGSYKTSKWVARYLSEYWSKIGDL
jgi:hypothetical protein